MQLRIALLPLAALLGCQSVVEHRELHEDGTPKSEGRLVGGKQVGPWVHYWPNGQARSRGSYIDDVQTGAWEWFYENGAPRMRGTYTDEHSDGQ